MCHHMIICVIVNSVIVKMINYIIIKLNKNIYIKRRKSGVRGRGRAVGKQGRAIVSFYMFLKK